MYASFGAFKMVSYDLVCSSAVFFESSVQLKRVSVRSEKPICASPHLSEVSPALTIAPSRPFKEDRLTLPVSTPLSSRRSVV